MKLFTLISIFLCQSLIFWAQENKGIVDHNLYRFSTRILKGDYSYTVDVQHKYFISLYNTEHKWVNQDCVYRSTGEIFTENGGVFTSLEPYKTARQIVDETFTTEEAAKLKNEYAQKLIISLYINSFTGVIEDVEFQIYAITPFAGVPVEYYREIELELKEHVRFQPTALGMSLNYIFFFWLQLPKGHDGPRSYYGDPDREDLELNPLPPIKPVDGDLELVD